MIKKNLLKSWLLLLCMVVGVGSAWADDGDTHDFAQDFSQLLNNNASISPINIDAQNYSVKKVVVSYRYNKTITNAVTVEVSVGGTSWGSQYVNGTGKDYTTLEFGGDATEGAIKITFTNNAGDGTGKGTFYVNNVRLVEGASSGGSSAAATTTAIDATGITNTDIYSGTAAGSLSAAVTITESGAAVDGATVTWSGNNDEVATIDAETGAVTLVAAGTVTFTATYAGVEDEYNASSDTYELTVTDSTPIPTHTVTFSVNGVTSNQDFEEGAAIEFPDDPADVSGKTFVGWVTNAIDGTTDDAPEFVTTATMGESNITYYAVFAEVIPGTANTFTDVMTTATFGSPSSYTDWSGKHAENGSSAVYAGNTTTNATDAIQMRSNNNNSGIVSTTSGGKVKKVVVTWDSNTVSGRKLDIYGSNKAYTSATNLYAKDNQGTLLSSLEHTTNSESELTIDGDYEYIGIRSNNGALYLTNISIEWLSGTPDTYASYCTTVAAVDVVRPVITLGANPFTISTTVTITCETENADIMYSFDDETWNDYSSPFAIDATTTIYAKAIKDEKESTVATVTATKNLIVPTVTIDATGITNTDVYVGTEAGSLAATVIYEEAVPGAVVTWSGNNDEVATINAETGAVTLVAAGTVTFTATYAGNSDYAEKTATYEMTVTSSDPNVPGTENNPYTVAEIIDFIETLGGETSAEVFVKGIISQIDSYNSKYSSITYWISDDGTTTTQFECYSGLGLNSANFSSINDLQLGDEVVVAGTAKKYGDVYEFNYNNYIVSLVRKVATPEFSPAAGAVAEGTEVTISTTTDDATIYYTTNGDEPTTESTVYTEAITINEAMTIKAIAVKNGMPNSDVATAAYTIAAPCATPTFSPAAGVYTEVQEVEISSTTEDATIYYTTDGTEPTTNSTEYTGAITVNEDMTIKAIAVKDGMANSAVAEAAYEINLPDYATLPFVFDGGKADIENTNGLTQDGLGSDYKSSPYLKFDGSNDYVILKINEAGALFFDINGNGFSGGTFTVQTSANGVDYNDLKAYTDLGATQTESFMLATDVRYIKWIYTNKASGNVGMGNIKVIKDASIVISDAKYATFSSTLATDFSETGITVYTAKVNGNYVTLTKVEDGIVPANTGVVLFSETADTYEVPFTTTENSLEDNDLLISDGTIAGDGSTIFALANKKQGVGFYRVAEEVAVPAGTPYLTIEAAAREFFGFGSETTSINGALSIKNGASVDAPVYNLNGQRILKPAKGLYIVNGKKAVIK